MEGEREQKKTRGLACRNAQTRAEKASCVDCCSWLRERRAYSTARVICDAIPVVKEKKKDSESSLRHHRCSGLISGRSP